MALSNALTNSILQPGVCTSTNRPANPYEGQFIYETDTDSLYVYNGTSWVLPGSSVTPSSSDHFTRKGYVDSNISTVSSAASAAQTTANNAATAATNANTNANGRVSRSGDVMSGALNMGGRFLYLRTGDGNHYLHYDSSIDGPTMAGWNACRIYITGTGSAYTFKNNGNATAPGTWVDSSSIRYKENIRDIESFDDIDNIRPIVYSYKDDEEKKDNFGFIAEEIAEIYPELVNFDENGIPDGVAYSRFAVLAISEIKNLRKRLTAIEEKLNELA